MFTTSIQYHEDIWTLLSKIPTIYVPMVKSAKDGRPVYYPEKEIGRSGRIVRCFLFEEDSIKYVAQCKEKSVFCRNVPVNMLTSVLLSFSQKSDIIDDVAFVYSSIDYTGNAHTLGYLWKRYEN